MPLKLTSTDGLALIVSAPSGTGKTTVCGKLRELLPELGIKVSHTTRNPRTGEVDGVHYHFIDTKEFQEGVDRGDFLEWAQVHTDLYGTLRQPVEEQLSQGRDLLMELDVQGEASLREQNFPGIFVLILPPSLPELERRLVHRATETPEKIARRLETAKTEIARYPLYDYVVTNHVVEDTVQTMMAILHAERHRSTRYCPDNEEIRSLMDPGIKT